MSSAKVLIVDDEVDIRDNLCDLMELEGFGILSAGTGLEALKVLETETPDIVISDLMMPEMSGLEFVEELAKRQVELPVVIMTAFGTVDYAVKAMKAGAADFVTKPIDQDYMLKVIERVLATARLQRKVREQEKQMEADLALAGRIQRALLPKPINTPRINLSYRHEPVIQIGGDHLSVHVYDEDHLSVGVFDVSGHGVAASMVASMVHNELMARLREERPPFNVIERLNRFVKKEIGETGMYLTMVIAEIDLTMGTLKICNAGHQECLVWSQADSTMHSIPAHIAPVGFGAPPPELETETRLSASSGDRIILFTDGFPETRGQDGKLMGRDVFRDTIQRNIHVRTVDFLDSIFREVDAFGDDSPEDDRTLVLLEVN